MTWVFPFAPFLHWIRLYSSGSLLMVAMAQKPRGAGEGLLGDGNRPLSILLSLSHPRALTPSIVQDRFIE